MTDRERLLDLINQALLKMKPNFTFEALADYLLENGVIVPPCKVGDTAFIIPTYENSLKEISETVCISLSIGSPSNTTELLNKKNKLYSAGVDMFGRTVFLTREEAEKVLAKRNCDIAQNIESCEDCGFCERDGASNG